MALRILIADDQAMVRAGFRMILEAETDMEVVGEAKDGEEALAAAGRVDRTSSSWTSACRASTALRRRAGCSRTRLSAARRHRDDVRR
jgi:hypothetical protein